MRRTIRLFFCISITVLFAYSIRAQEWQISNVINGSDIEPRYSIVDNQNNLIILGYFADTIFSQYYNVSFGSRDIVLLKINQNGDLVWLKKIGSVQSDIAGGIAIDINNNIYFSGTFYQNCWFTNNDSLKSLGNADIFLAKYSAFGEFQWAKRVGSSSTVQSVNDLKFDGYENLIMTGLFQDSLIIGSSQTDLDTLIGNSSYSHFIASFSLNGNHIWSKRFLGTSNLTRFRRIGISQNGYYFGGFFQGSVELDIATISSLSTNYYDAFIYKTNFNGDGQWVRKISGQNTDNFRSLATDEFDNVYLLGNYNSLSIIVDSTETIANTIAGNVGGYDTYMAKYNRSGILQWFLRKGSTLKDIYNDFVVRNNIIYATGYFGTPIIFNDDTLRTNSPNMSDPFLAAFNEIGDPIAAVSMQGTDPNTVTDIVNAGTVVNMDSDSRAYVAGYYKARQLQIGDSTYTSSNFNKSDMFFAIYEHPPKAVITDEQMVSCNGLSDGMLQVTPYFMGPPYTYKWSHNPGLNQSVATNLPAGTYTVTVKDADLDSAQITAVVTQPAPIAVAEIITEPSCNNLSDGTIDITVTGGTPAYAYAWTTLGGSGVDPTAEDQTEISKGTYYVIVTDDNECTAKDTFIVSEPLPISFAGSLITDVILPPGGNGAIDPEVSGGTSPYGYAWTGPDSYTSTQENITGLDGGNYTLQVTDDNACTGDTVFLVYEAGLFLAEISQKTDVTCYGLNDGTASVSVMGGEAPFSYKWSDLAAFPSNDTFALRTGMAPGTYYITITDNDLKTANTSVKINSPSSALTLLLQPSDLRCYNDNSGVIDLTVTGGTLPYSFDWSNDFTGEDLVSIGAGNYSVTVTDAGGCVKNDGATINQPVPFITDISIDDPVHCFGDNTAVVTANASGGTGGYSYVWNDPGNQSTKTAYELSAGNITVIVTDLNECISMATINIPQPGMIEVEETHTHVTCAGEDNGQIIPVATGGTVPYEYLWSDGQTTRVASNLEPGIYTLTITDFYNCANNGLSVLITEPVALHITSQDSDSNTITVVADGGTPPLTYTITGGSPQANGEFTGLANGTYTVEVNDANDCGPVVSDEFVISVIGIEEPMFISLNIFPNPSPEGKFNLIYESGDNKLTVEILNITGTVVYNKKIESSGGKVNALIDLSSFPKGIYLMKINNNIIKERLIIN